MRPFASNLVYRGETHIVCEKPMKEREMKILQNDEIRGEVRKSYGEIAKAGSAGCGCGQGIDQTPEGVSVGMGYIVRMMFQACRRGSIWAWDAGTRTP